MVHLVQSCLMVVCVQITIVKSVVVRRRDCTEKRKKKVKVYLLLYTLNKTEDDGPWFSIEEKDIFLPVL